MGKKKVEKLKKIALAKAKAKAEGTEYVEEPEEKEEEEDVVVIDEPEEPEEPDEPEVEEEPPKVTLTDEEKAVKFRKRATPDVGDYLPNTNFSKFSVPSKDEGFDNIRFE